MSVRRGPEAGATSWRFRLSLAYWALRLLGSPGVPEITPDDSPTLHKHRSKWDGVKPLERLRNVARGIISWEEYGLDAILRGGIFALLEDVVRMVDILCTTPAQASTEPNSSWKRDCAKRFAFDEAAALNRSDMLSVWGNTMLPCFLAGDPGQLPPPFISSHAKDSRDNIYHRFPHEAKLSSTEFLLGLGVPIFRLDNISCEWPTECSISW